MNFLFKIVNCYSFGLFVILTLILLEKVLNIKNEFFIYKLVQKRKKNLKHFKYKKLKEKEFKTAVKILKEKTKSKTNFNCYFFQALFMTGKMFCSTDYKIYFMHLFALGRND